VARNAGVDPRLVRHHCHDQAELFRAPRTERSTAPRSPIGSPDDEPVGRPARFGDITFDLFAEIDLGGRTVRLFRFGPGNGPGDTVAYLPDTRTAWTGNYLCHAGIAPMLLQGGPQPYIESLKRMRDELPTVDTIVPGHGPIGNGPEAVEWLIEYLESLTADVTKLRAAGRDEDQTLDECPSPFADGLDKRVVEALAEYDVPTEQTRQHMLALMRHLHRLNVVVTYRTLESESIG
jgi:cyclase